MSETDPTAPADPGGPDVGGPPDEDATEPADAPAKPSTDRPGVTDPDLQPFPPGAPD